MTAEEREKLTREIERGAAEDKQLICNALCKALMLTRAGCDIKCIKYNAEKEIAAVHYVNGARININVAMDSGIALIEDILKGVK